ncbi:DEAD/DEAH box helicase family protein [Buchananella felis]|uniref:DEAD/DEAH box helicase family protein n=1 Tax=Buchananella felis TaxID=3231492 RepID=UPI0035286976
MGQAAWEFTGVFRSYQHRILDRAQALLADHKLHVVAAPGSGKTILGLELAGRLGAPTLVLSPSLAIRDQWVQRLRDNFRSPVGAPGHDAPLPAASVSLRSPAFLTSTTYQSLFAAYSRGLDGETGESFQDADLAALLAGVTTVVLDEAHHLRTAWHRALVAFLAQLRALNPGLAVIALTATPPYDSTPAEWQRYEDLCGPIDAEISVPELIHSGDLAPHQDYVLVNEPTAAEVAQLSALRGRTAAVLADLARPRPEGPAPLALLERSPLFVAPAEHVDECLDDEVGAVGWLHLCRRYGITPPPVLTHLLDVGGLEASAEDGLQFVLTHPRLFGEEFVGAVRALLAAHHLLDAKGVINRSDLAANRLLLNSVGKLDSIAQIALAEARHLGADLRLLVLADHIRSDSLPLVGGTEPLVRLGVVPAFEAIRRCLTAAGLLPSGLPDVPPAPAQSLALLSGSCVVLPTGLGPALRELAGPESVGLTLTPLPACPNYATATFAGGSKAAVRVLTEAFARGLVTVLVGTAALLGEGWDCPQLNTLVLASTVKATMMTNQMRGRAIRIDPGAPGKVANIWHLATADADDLLSSGGQRVEFAQSHDVRKLARRFDTFVGPHATQPRVESGVLRCAGSPELWHKRRATALNADNLARAAHRAVTRELWRGAIDRHDVNSPTGLDLSLEVEAAVRPTRVVSALDLLFAAVEAVALGMAYQLSHSVRAGVVHSVVLVAALAVLLVLAVVWSVRLVVRRRFLDPRRRTLAQADALLQALRHAGAVTSDAARVRVSPVGADYELTVHLSGASLREQEVFAGAVAELFAPVRTARYLLVPAHSALLLGPVLVQNVPSVLAARRENVDLFLTELARRGLRMRAHYTRNEQGRVLLTRARRAAAVNLAASLTRTKRVLTADRL